MESVESKLIDRIRALESYAEAKKEVEERVAEDTGRRKLPMSIIEEDDNLTYDSAYIKELTKLNENKLFIPAHKSIVLAEKSIKEWRQKNYEIAIENMEEAHEYFEHIEIKLNLGKMYLSRGEEYEEGIALLLEYYLFSSIYDFYSIEIKKLFSLKENQDGTLTGTISGVDDKLDFNVDKERHLNFEEEKEVFVADIPLPFKLPISLDLQRKDNKEIMNEDYRYLKKLVYDSNEIEFEIMIERHRCTKFLSEFYGTVLEWAQKEGDIIPLAAFEELKMDLFLANIKREHYIQGFDEPAEIAIPEDKSLISILKIKVIPKSMNEFFMLFREFARRNLISKESDWEVEESYREYEQQNAEYEDVSMQTMERRLEYEQLVEHGKEYAKLYCILTNIERNVSDPYIYEEEDYQKFYNVYVSSFQDQYMDIINQHRINVE
ncbi:hypothetical protein [Paenisporosarcina sp. TG20]|uniref:hypothetical protein n=1 Tax=Paenisporosarcina sp. TG20 TaxID=1211706 RepID=UPI0002DC0DD3|nr:hypothetical protein [Paenisporosarcina sp. TG20]